MSPFPEPREPDRKARFDQEFAALSVEWLKHMDEEDREILEETLRHDEDLTHHFHNLLSELLLPHQAAPFLMAAAHHLRSTASKATHKTPILAGIYALALRPPRPQT
mgnify:CR=1 FL=1